MIDTIAALITLSKPVDEALFNGRVDQVDLRTGIAASRLFRHSTDAAYAPRVTYYPKTQSLRVEFSVVKMAASNPLGDVTPEIVNTALDRVDAWISSTFGPLPSVRTWKVQRVDYAVNLHVGALLPHYLSVLNSLHLSSSSRFPHPTGVLWKSGGSRGRWVKFYDKARECGDLAGGVLRFEVSNYRDACDYMARKWFVCPRIVQEFVQFGRAAFVLAHIWNALGLGHTDLYERREFVLARLRDTFGQRNVAVSAHALMCIQQHGTRAYGDLHLISKSTYYRWRTDLAAHGFLTDGARDAALTALRLPLESVFARVQNLKSSEPAPHYKHEKKSGAENWAKLALGLGFNPKNPENSVLLEAFNGWSSGSDWGNVVVDSANGKSELGDSFAAVR